MTIMPKLQVRSLHKSFGSTSVLSGVDFSLDSGKSLAVLGRSGTGKSVLFKCIVGLMTQEQGDVIIDGQSLSAATARQREALLAKIAVVFQGSALFDSLNVWRNIMFTRMMSGGTSKKDLIGRAESLLQKVGLNGDDLTKAPSELSGGMKKRVAIARA